MPVTFRVSVGHSGRRRFVRVSVYETAEELRAAADRYNKRIGAYTPGEFDHAHGVTHSFWSVLIDGDGKEVRTGPSAAHIRLYRGALGMAVVTHEVAHAALAIYRQDCFGEQGSVHGDMEQEEVACYLIGELAARVVSGLYRYGFYEDVKS